MAIILRKTFKALAVCVALTLIATACSRAPVRIDRPMQLSFQFPFLEPDAEGYTVLLSEQDATTLGSSTESTVWPDQSAAREQHVQTFVATNFIDEYDGDDFEPDVPCLQDAIMIQEPSGGIRELFPPGECFGRGWFVGVSDVRPGEG